jgi:EmrB/QacA subfamily drug resistance transporter
VTEAVLTRPTAGPARPAQPRPPWRALPVLLVGAFLPVLDAFIVNVALATIGRDLHAGPAELELTVSGYGVAYACSLVAGGRLGDRLGRRRVFLAGMAAFTAASVLCGVAPSASLLIVFRVLQGGAAALMFPQVLAAIQAGFDGPDRQRALGFLGAVVGAAGAVGQIVGGTLLAADIAGMGWRPIFLVNVPIGVGALLVGRRMLPESRTPTAPAIDAVGGFSLAATIALVLLPLTLGRASGWPAWTWVSLAAAPFAGAFFVASQRRFERSGRVPLVPLSLIEVRYARLGLTAMLLFATCVGGFLFSLTMVLQAGHGYSALKSGMTMVPSAVAFFLMALVTRRLTARFGDRLVAGGAVVFALGLAGFAAVVAASGAQLDAVAASLPLIVLGLGWAAAMVPLMGVVMAGLPAQRAGLAGGVLSTALQVGLASGASIVGSVLFSVAGSGADVGRWRDATVVMTVVETALALATAVTVWRLRRAASR